MISKNDVLSETIFIMQIDIVENDNKKYFQEKKDKNVKETLELIIIIIG